MNHRRIVCCVLILLSALISSAVNALAVESSNINTFVVPVDQAMTLELRLSIEGQTVAKRVTLIPSSEIAYQKAEQLRQLASLQAHVANLEQNQTLSERVYADEIEKLREQNNNLVSKLETTKESFLAKLQKEQEEKQYLTKDMRMNNDSHANVVEGYKKQLAGLNGQVAEHMKEIGKLKEDNSALAFENAEAKQSHASQLADLESQLATLATKKTDGDNDYLKQIDLLEKQVATLTGNRVDENQAHLKEITDLETQLANIREKRIETQNAHASQIAELEGQLATLTEMKVDSNGSELKKIAELEGQVATLTDKLNGISKAHATEVSILEGHIAALTGNSVIVDDFDPSTDLDPSASGVLINDPEGWYPTKSDVPLNKILTQLSTPSEKQVE